MYQQWERWTFYTKSRNSHSVNVDYNLPIKEEERASYEVKERGLRIESPRKVHKTKNESLREHSIKLMDENDSLKEENEKLKKENVLLAKHVFKWYKQKKNLKLQN